IRSELNHGVDGDRLPGIVVAQPKTHEPWRIKRKVSFYRHPSSPPDLPCSRAVQSNSGAHQRAGSIYAKASRYAQADAARVGAWRQHEIELDRVVRDSVHQIDAAIDTLIPNRGVMRYIPDPVLWIAAARIVSNAWKGQLGNTSRVCRCALKCNGS